MDNISASEQIRQETSKWANPNLSKKIDGVIATVMTLDRAIRNQEYD